MAASPVGRRELRLLGAGVMLIAACYGLARYAYGFFVPVFRTAFGLDAATVGAIASGSYAAYCVAIVLTTILIPRVGARSLAVAAGGIATGGILLVALAPNATVLAVGVLVAGSSTGVASPPLADAVARTVRTSVRDRMQTVINAGAGVGVAVAGPVALLTHEQWRSAWISFAIACAAVTVYVAFAVPSGSPPPAGRSPRTALLPRPLFPAGSGRLMAAAALMGAASSAVWTFGRDVLVSVGGMDEAASTTAWILLGASGVLGAAAGDLARRLGIATGWAAAMMTMGIATALLAAFPDLPVVAWITAAAFGAVYMTLTGLLLIWGTEAYPIAPAAGVGLAFLVMSLGQAAAAPIVGGLSEGMDSRAAFTAAALAAVAGAFIRPKRRERPPASTS
ncbi:MFS transporter [Microbacterium betulae]|uniref:MFS transporter n=1 Tax=Microbacterium betulae TaxID=2981139 RepID=A0AA97FLV6_9MICO|nr:MFS transporter [Microbacterium sp. AB]WOF24620.1 MFS transporter [Microbacterium sp. AB]